jgi:hypothetical protein
MKINKLVLFGIAILLVPFILATFPGIPHQFYGGVIVNGVPASGGTVTTKINGELVGTTKITLGKYGYKPIFFIEDKDYNKNNKEIIFYVNGFQAGEYIFENGASTRLDLIVGNYTNICGDSILGQGEKCDEGADNGKRCDNSKGDCSYCSSSCQIINLKQSSSSESDHDKSGRIKELSFSCEPNWQCTNWGECVDETTTRQCRDNNECGTSINKPVENRLCYLSQSKIDLENKIGNTNNLWIFILLALIIIVIITIIFNRNFFNKNN